MKIIFVHCGEEMRYKRSSQLWTQLNKYRTKLTSLLGAGLYVGHIWKSYMLHIHDFHIFPVIIHYLEGLFGSNKKKRQKFIPELNYWQTFGPFKIKMQGNQKPRFNNRGYRCFVLLLCFVLFYFVFFWKKW